MPEEPKKPNQLNLFLQFRKEMIDEAPVYKNLPPQEGLFEKDPAIEEKKQLSKEAKQMQYNIDFRLLDLDADIANAKKSEQVDQEREEAVFEEVEKRMVKKKGTILKNRSETQTTGDFGIVSYHLFRWTQKKPGLMLVSKWVKKLRTSLGRVGFDLTVSCHKKEHGGQ